MEAIELATSVRYDNIDFLNERSQRQFSTYLVFRAVRQLFINTGIKQLRYVAFQNHEALLSVKIHVLPRIIRCLKPGCVTRL